MNLIFRKIDSMVKSVGLKELEVALATVDPRLCLFRNRGNGDAIFPKYDATGFPGTTQVAFIIRRGKTEYCAQLDGPAFPPEGIHDWGDDWGDGWGCAVLPVHLFDRDEALCDLAMIFGRELSKKCTENQCQPATTSTA